MSAMVTHDILQRSGLSEEELFHQALKSGRKLFPEVITDMQEPLYETEFPRVVKTQMITNTMGLNGAACVFYPGVMESIAKRCPSGVFLIPTSIHEFLAEPEENAPALERMEESLKATNRALTEPREWLSDEIYHYDPTMKRFERAASYLKRRSS